MIAIAMAWIAEKVMTDFFFTFLGKDRKQESGGPIGDVLTQEISRFMENEFYEVFTLMMTNLEIKNEPNYTCRCR